MAEPDAIITAMGVMLGFWLMLLLLFYIFWPRR